MAGTSSSISRHAWGMARRLLVRGRERLGLSGIQPSSRLVSRNHDRRPAVRHRGPGCSQRSPGCGEILTGQHSLLGFVVLWAAWLISQIVTDVVVGSAFKDYARGWAGIPFLAVNFAGIFFLVSTPRRARIFAVGLAVGGFLGFLLVRDPLAALDPWKWGLAVPVGLVLVAGLSGRRGALGSRG